MSWQISSLGPRLPQSDLQCLAASLCALPQISSLFLDCIFAEQICEYNHTVYDTLINWFRRRWCCICLLFSSLNPLYLVFFSQKQLKTSQGQDICAKETLSSGHIGLVRRADERQVVASQHQPVTRQPDSRPLCKYGVSCYRKNPSHFEQFRHPGNVL